VDGSNFLDWPETYVRGVDGFGIPDCPNVALREREGRIDFHQLRPPRARLVYAPEMTVTGGDQHAARIGGGGAGDPLYEPRRNLLPVPPPTI